MEALRGSCVTSPHLAKIQTRVRTHKSVHLHLPSNSSLSSVCRITSSRSNKLFSTTISTEAADTKELEKFDWFSEWYAIMPVCDLDKRVPHAKKVMGLDVVVWWDRNESAWKVFDDSCPHRLAPLSEGRIDQWGRLQCVYHGWCFNGSGHCKFIPQAPPDAHAPPISTSKKACVSVYPSTVQHDIVWFWPNTDPQYKDILLKKKPPFIPELDDPSYTKLMANRDIPYGYEVLIENLMDPAHVPYAHYGIMRVPTDKNSPKADREGGRPVDINVQTVGADGFIGKQQYGSSRFIPPCVYYASPNTLPGQTNESVPTSGAAKKEPPPRGAQRRVLLIFICIPVSPGKSRLIWTFPRNFGIWIDRIVPRWMFHIQGNLILDSDLYLLHVEERRIMDVGSSNWQKACFVPTKSDGNVIAFRKWLNKYSCGQVNWGTKFTGAFPPSPPRKQLMDRYWSHVVNCSSCSVAHKGLNVLEVILQVISIASIGIVAATKQSMMSVTARTTLVSVAILCFGTSRGEAFISLSFSIDSSSRFGRSPMNSGIRPTRWLPNRLISVRFFNSEKLSGISPLRLLRERSNDFKFTKPENSDGM